MAHVSEEIMEDMAILLEDCSKVFRKQQADEQARLDTTLSLVEVESTHKDLFKYRTLADACDKYAEIARPAQESR